jgi:hypothetical protein
MGMYSYRLRQIDLDGTFEYTNSIEIEVYAPDEFVLAQNYPNPFNPSTAIEFSVPEISEVNISVYSVIGEMVASVVNNTFDAGYHTVNFNAFNLPSGTYIYTIKASGQNGTFVESKKMLLLK